MAYVTPNTKLQLFQGINLDNRYLHTIYFASHNIRDAWFAGKVYKSYNDLMFRRYTDNQVKVEADVTTLLGVTYMRFQNDRTNDRWYYAFVLAVDYVNENTSIITYEIDVMQTFFFYDASLQPCMVLREHTSDDTFGINLEAEPIGSDVYDCDEVIGGTNMTNNHSNHFNTYKLIMNTTEEPSEANMINNNLFNGTKFYSLYANTSTAAQLKTYLADIIGGNWDEQERSADVIDMFTFPEAFCNLSLNSNRYQLTFTHPHNIDGYIPKNRKLFGYPFAYIQGTTGDGSGCMYKWEYFDGDVTTSASCTFQEVGIPIGGGQIICYPRNYNGITENYDAKMVMNDFPKNPYAFDGYEAFIASGGKTRLENASNITTARGVLGITSASANFVNSAVTSVNQIMSGATGTDTKSGKWVKGGTSSTYKAQEVVSGINNIVQAGVKLGGAITDYIEAKNKIAYEWNDASYTPNQVVGACTPNVAVADNELNFYFYSVHVRVDELKRLDDFLSCYGYATNKVKIPNLHSRQYWNFVQTQGAMVIGNMPSSSKEAIGRILDGGITFWHDGDHIGDYNQSVTYGTINNPIISV